MGHGRTDVQVTLEHGHILSTEAFALERGGLGGEETGWCRCIQEREEIGQVIYVRWLVSN